MAEKGEVEFPFNIKDFQKMVDQMGDSLNSISKKVDGFGKTMENSVAKGLMKATAMMRIFIAGFKSVMKNMPEIGQAFKIASDIIAKEFFFPIRQQIMPYLQKMLDWVRDHRTLFAKWGNTVASVLKVVINVGKQLWQTFSRVSDILINSLQKGLGTSFKSIDEFINVLSVKVAVITMYMGELIESMYEKISPTFEYIVEKGAQIIGFFGDLLDSWLILNEQGDSLFTVCDKIYDIFDKLTHIVGEALIGFIEGLIEPLKDLMTPVDNICESFQRLLSIFGDDNSGIKGVFKWLGGFVGNTLLIAFLELAWAIDTIVVGIQTLAQSGSLLKDLFTGDWGSLKKDWEATKNMFSDYNARSSAIGSAQVEAFKKMFSINDNIHDGIVTKNGKVIKIDPQDNIFAFKNAFRIPNMFGGDVTSKNYDLDNSVTNNTNTINNTTNKYDNQSYTNFTNNKESHLNLANNRTNFSAPMTITINVTATEGNAQMIGQQVAQSVHDSFTERVRMQMMAGGY